MKSKIILFLFALSLGFMVQCTSEEIIESGPKIRLIAPEEGVKLKPGHGIHLEAILTDADGMDSYEIKVEHQFEEGTPNQDLAFNYFNLWEEGITGQQKVDLHHHDILIPETSLCGKYTFTMVLRSKSGLKETVVRTIYLDENGETGVHPL